MMRVFIAGEVVKHIHYPTKSDFEDPKLSEMFYWHAGRRYRISHVIRDEVHLGEHVPHPNVPNS